VRARTLLLTLALSVLGPRVAAQSLFNAAGLGVPIEALDGKARALGNLGIGLRGASFMPTDPAAVGRFSISTGIVAGQPSWVDFTSEAGPSGDFQGNRFPLLGMAYPLFSGMMSIQIGSFLDQHYRAESLGSVDLGNGPLETTDTFEQDGSVSNLNLGYARMLRDDVAVGLTVGRYAGSLVRTLTRSFGVDGAGGVEDYVTSGRWSYTGYSLTAGVSADVGSAVRVAGSVQIPTKLDAVASEGTEGQDGSFDIPIQYRLGASAQLAPGLVVSASAALADWSRAEDGLVGTARAGNTNGFGIGAELTRAHLFGKEAPLRFGFRRTGLPFSFNDEAASERIFSGGFGLALNTTGEVVLAGVDFAIERGRRTGAGITESFWRATVSLMVSGF
jgi:hypothetical protein